MKIFTTITVLSLALWTVGCSDQTTEDVGKAIDSAGDAASGAMSDASDAASEAADSVKDAAGTTVEAAKVAAEDAAETAKDTAGSAVDAAGSAVETAKDAASDAASTAKDAAGSAVDTAKGTIEEGMAAVTEKASATLSGIEGGPKLLKNFTGFFDSAKETLSGITDTESAQAAVPKLGEMGTTLDGLSESMNKLPARAKTALAGVIEKGTDNLKALVEKANAIPGVKEIIQPKLDEVMQKLSALTGQE